MSSEPMQRVPYAGQPAALFGIASNGDHRFELPNFRVVQNLGVVRGIVVRSRNIFATIGAGLQTIVGGNITVWTKLCEQTSARRFRDHDSACDGNRRECGYRRTLRHDGDLDRA